MERMEFTREVEQGYEDNRFESAVSPNFHCPICMNVLKEPVMCRRNQHYFCNPCITRHLGNSSTCPSCMEELTVETLTRVPRIVADCLAELRISCNYFSRGCRELVELGSLETHVAGCGFSPVQCSNDGCDVVLNKRDRIQHEAELCHFRKLKCHDCVELRREVDGMKADLTEIKEGMAAMKVDLKEDMAAAKVDLKEDMAAMKVDLKEDMVAIKEDMVAVKEQLDVVATQSDKFIECVHEMQEGIMSEVRGIRAEIKEEIKSINKTVPEPSLTKTKGDIIIAGGEVDLNVYNSVELFSWSKKSWTVIKPMTKPRSEASSFVYENQMVVAGGYIEGQRHNEKGSIEKMNMQDEPGEWSDFPCKLPGNVYDHKVVCYKDRLIMIGGNDKDKISDAIHEMLLVPPYSDKLLTRMPEPRYHHGVELLKDRIFIVGGGKTYRENLNSILMYDINKNVCKELSPLPYAVSEMATVVWKNNVVVIGGRDKESKALNSVIMYDVNTEESKMLPFMKCKRRACSAVITGDVIVVMGGYGEKGHCLNSVECFDLYHQIWEDLPPMNEYRAYATAVVKS